MKAYDIDSALDLAGSGKYQVFLTLICGIVLYAVNSEAYSIGYVLPAAQCDLDLDTSGKSLLTGITFIGIICSQYFWGYYADTRGRRNLIIVTLLLTCISTTLASIAPSFWIFSLLRFFSGFFISAPSVSIFVYLGEFLTNRNRSGYMSAGGFFVGLAICGLPASAWLIMSFNFKIDFIFLDFIPWRLFIFASGFTSLLGATGLLFFPETPKFLAQTGRYEECLQVLEKIYKANNPSSGRKYPVQLLSTPSTEETSLEKSLSNELRKLLQQTASLFNSEHVKNTLVCCTAQFGAFATSSGLLLWYPDILTQLAANSGKVMTVCQAIDNSRNNTISEEVCGNGLDASVFQQNLYIGFGYLIGFVITGMTIQKLGTRNILFAFLVISGGATMSLYWVTNDTMIDALFIILLVLSGLCVTLLNVMTVEIYPTHLRAMAVSIAMLTGRLGSVVSSSVLAYFLELNCNATFMVYAASLFGCGILALLLPKISSKKEETNEKMIQPSSIVTDHKYNEI